MIVPQAGDQPLFVNNRSTRLSRDAVERIVRNYVVLASHRCQTLRCKRVSPHCFRHSAAMEHHSPGDDGTGQRAAQSSCGRPGPFQTLPTKPSTLNRSRTVTKRWCVSRRESTY